MDWSEKIDCRASNKGTLIGNLAEDEKRDGLRKSSDMNWSEKIDLKAFNKPVLKYTIPLHLLYVKNVLTQGSQYK